ncbi:transcription antitermination factor NusB [Mycoplasmopsis gallinarum]|uniref:transcription antitermination factor NusB n=1 Tax=Mycoplasmopsis gallinarum TaxID=29557 RepID=UPI00056C473E|nr:transcription antitermination factor NusB [Mycoplasmopsis gallinarum]
MNTKRKSQRELRIEIINFLYQAELKEELLNPAKIFLDNEDLENSQFLKLEVIAKEYSLYKKWINQFLKEGWSWNRIEPLIRAILLYACYEFLANNQPKVVINEAMEITKLYYGKENKIKNMVNAILQEIYKLIMVNEFLLRKSEQTN